jgi:hypothetical protein
MESQTESARRFMNEYSARFNAAIKGGANNVEDTAGTFASCFVEAGPSGITCGSNNTQFREMIPKGYQFYRNIGVKSMEIVEMEATPLDGLHIILKCEWKSVYDRPDLLRKGIIRFNVIYLLQQSGETFKIFAYITGDEQKSLREHGLV